LALAGRGIRAASSAMRAAAGSGRTDAGKGLVRDTEGRIAWRSHLGMDPRAVLVISPHGFVPWAGSMPITTAAFVHGKQAPMGVLPQWDFDLTGVHVLAVDDHADSLEILSALLRYTGALVTTARSVRAADAVLQRVRPDVIVSDLAMANGTGWDLVRAIRRDARLQDVPAIAITAFGRFYTADQTRRAGFNAYLEKPIDPVSLCRAIRSARRKAHRDESPETGAVLLRRARPRRRGRPSIRRR
jgi:CheY-like chemotaxis protein